MQPLLACLKPQRIFEVGSEDGFSTKRLVQFCRENDAVLHSIDPNPRYDVAKWQSQSEGCLRVHRGLSLDVLPTLDPCDAALIDGDHNWYTVYHELQSLDRRAREADRPFPLVFVHDVSWPYGRRDLYYNPDTIPVEFRQPYAKKSIVPDKSQLQESGGVNGQLANAIEENTPRNGVLTGVEDFARDSDRKLELMVISGYHGLGILHAEHHLENHDLAELLNVWKLPPAVARYMKDLEMFYLRHSCKLREQAEALRKRLAVCANQLGITDWM